MNKVLIGFAALLAIVVSTPYLAIATTTPSQEVKNAAAKGVSTFLKDPRIGNLNHIGFTTPQEAENAELGEGFQTYTVPPEVLGDSEMQDLPSSLQPINQWSFLILSGGEAKALLVVELVNGEWVPVSIGASVLAKELDGFLTAWPRSSGHQYKFARVYQARSDIIGVTRGGKLLGFVPITSLIVASGRERGSFAQSDIHNSQEMLLKLRVAAKGLNKKVTE